MEEAESLVVRLEQELIQARNQVIELEGIVAENWQYTREFARLATFPEENPNLVIETTLGGEILYFNPEARQLFPDLADLGFEHPLFCGIEEVVTTFQEGNYHYVTREVTVGDKVFEIKYCFLIKEDLIHMYAHDITARKQAEEEVKALARQLRSLTHQIVLAQEEERRRVAHELHDEAGQALVALKISLGLLYKDLREDMGELADNLSDAIALVDETRNRIRMIAHGLRPPELDTVGLNPALEGFCHDFSRRTQLDIRYLGVDLPPLPDTISISLYRFLQEALTNVVEHACADFVMVQLSCDGRHLQLSVADNGRGLDRDVRSPSGKRPSGLGFLGMRERLELLGGWLDIESEPGQGTHLTAQIPLDGIE
jgi:signal transduction histidine kinase